MADQDWRPISEMEGGGTYYLYRVGDLYPVIGWGDPKAPGHLWVLEEGGEEDREDRLYPLVGGDDWAPTHFAEIDHSSLPVKVGP